MYLDTKILVLFRNIIPKNILQYNQISCHMKFPKQLSILVTKKTKHTKTPPNPTISLHPHHRKKLCCTSDYKFHIRIRNDMLLGLRSQAIGLPDIIKLILNVSCFEHSKSQANDLNCFLEGFKT